jgi:hypothetical protein
MELYGKSDNLSRMSDRRTRESNSGTTDCKLYRPNKAFIFAFNILLVYKLISLPDRILLAISSSISTYTRSLSCTYCVTLSLSFAPTLERRTSVKRFVSTHFLNPKRDGMTLAREISLSQGRCLHKHRINADIIHSLSGIRTQCSIERRQFMP